MTKQILMAMIYLAITSVVTTQADQYTLNIDLETETGRLRGTMVLRYHNSSNEDLQEIRLRLDQNLDSSTQVLSVSDANDMKLDWSYLPFKFAKQASDKGQMRVTLPNVLEKGNEKELKIHFTVTDKKYVNEQMTVLQDDPFQSFDAWYPKAMTQEERGWSFNDDRPSDYDVTIKIPSSLIIASTGNVVEKKTVGNDCRILRLKARKVRGFTIYGSSLWKKHQRDVNGVKLSVYLPDEAKDWVKPILDVTANVIAFCSREYGDFPTRHLDIVGIGSLTDEAHGASAACNIVGIFLSNKLEKQYHWLIAHEVPHQYFGSSIGLQADSVGWAVIGLAMIMERHYMVDRGIEGPKRPLGQWAYFEAERRGYDTTLSQPLEGLLTAEAPWSFGWNMALRHGKAYAVCSMLEDLLGQEEFKGVVRKIISERADTLLNGADLISYCENVLGESLDWFAADWVNGHATLDYAVTDVKQADKGWEITVSRIGTAGFPVTVEVETKGGEKLSQRVKRQPKKDKLHFSLNDELKSVVIDPDAACPDLDRSNNQWVQEH